VLQVLCLSSGEVQNEGSHNSNITINLSDVQRYTFLVSRGGEVQCNMAVTVLSLSNDRVPSWAETSAGLEQKAKGSITTSNGRRTAEGRHKYSLY